jgi:hypothetical protein
MRVNFLGGVGTVTGSATLLERGPLKWLVDCGMYQGENQKEERNRSTQSYDPKHLSFIFLTHAHIDHSGLIPKIVKEGFAGKVICTKATFDLCEIMLRDSGHIQEMEAEWQNRKNKRSGREEASLLYREGGRGEPDILSRSATTRSFHWTGVKFGFEMPVISWGATEIWEEQEREEVGFLATWAIPTNPLSEILRD